MLNSNIYGIKNIWDIQLQHHISKFLLRLNNSDLLGLTTKIRIQQLQNNLWSTTNIFQYHNPIINGINKHSTNFKIIQLLKHLDIQISSHSSITWPNTIKQNTLPIENLLGQHKSYNTFKKQLHTKRILYLDQLTSIDNSVLLQ